MIHFHIPPVLVATVTFPGVAFKQFTQFSICKIRGVPVRSVQYFQFKYPFGFVEYDKSRADDDLAWLILGPFIVNSMAAAFLGFPSSLRSVYLEGASTYADVLLLWLAIATGMHSIPRRDECQLLREKYKRSVAWIITKITIYPILGFARLLAAGTFFWSDVIYGLSITLITPAMMVHYSI